MTTVLLGRKGTKGLYADYIIIGGGSAGCVLANRLSENQKVSVVLLEAGGKDWNPLIHIPAGYIKTMVNSKINWMFKTEPEEVTGGREIAIPRGKVLWGVFFHKFYDLY